MNIDDYNDQDAAATIKNLPDLWAGVTRGADRLPFTSRDAVDNLLVTALGALHQAGRILNAGTRTATGRVDHLNVSGGGVPKNAVEQVDVGFRGIKGDVQKSRIHHGRPWQALCLWSSEVIDALKAQGHPIGPGSAGENVTIGELDWARVRPGVHMRIGSVLCEVSAWALPCRKNAQWFINGEFNQMHHDRGPVSRAYATVLGPGLIRVHDEVVLEPRP